VRPQAQYSSQICVSVRRHDALMAHLRAVANPAFKPNLQAWGRFPVVRHQQSVCFASASRGTPQGADGVAYLKPGPTTRGQLGTAVDASNGGDPCRPLCAVRIVSAHLTAHPATPEPSVQAKSGFGCVVMAHPWHTPARPQTQQPSRNPGCVVPRSVVCHQQRPRASCATGRD
jgi:hypothetical protein